MPPRIFWSVFIVACFSTVVLSMIEMRPTGHSKQAPQATIIFPTVSAENIQQIILASGLYQVQLDRYPVGWKTSYRIGAQVLIEDRADEEMIQTFVQELMILQSKQPKIITNNELPLYGLDDSSYRHLIQIKYGSMNRSLQLGTAVPQQSLLYARLEKQYDLLQIPILFARWLQDIQQNPDSWRSRRLFHIDSQLIPNRWIWQLSGKNCITLYRNASTWYVEESNNNPTNTEHSKTSSTKITDRANPQVCNALIQTAINLRIYGFVDKNLHETSDFFRQYLLIGYHDQYIQEYLAIGSEVKIANILCYYVAKVRLKPELELGQVYLVPAGLIQPLFYQTQQFYDPFILREEILASCRLMIRSGSINWRLEQTNESFYLTEPKYIHVPAEKIEQFYQMLQSLQASEFVYNDSIPTNAKYETLEFANSIVLQWHTLSDGSFLIQQSTDTLWRKLSKSPDILTQNHFQFYNHRVDAFVFADVIEVHLQHGQKIYKFRKQQENWPKEVADLLRSCAWIMADAVLGEESDRGLFDCHDSAEDNITIFSKTGEFTDEPPLMTPQIPQPPLMTPQIPQQRVLILGKRVKGQSFAIWVSGFPYVYQIGPNLRLAFDALIR